MFVGSICLVKKKIYQTTQQTAFFLKILILFIVFIHAKKADHFFKKTKKLVKFAKSVISLVLYISSNI